MVLNIDLNNPPLPADGMVPGGDPVDLSLSIGLPRESGLLPIRTTTSFESVDDEVIICSPRSFAEARDKARRNRREVEVIDAENIFQTDQSAGSVPITNKRCRRGSLEHTDANVNHPINSERNKKPESDHAAEDTEVPCIVVPFQKKPEFKCPVCISPVVEETSTKCGHIFCKKCIHAAIAAQSKCPTCRRKLKVKDTIRIYLPASD
ncbi:E3 ubiquitin-protein ligase complex slx8-rfp subunit slx8-like isoform X2 [Diospyros lotus]|uniref:E3 ubiquitin-protein ligase complex slx8-rfp subunit slx8-like isoform X2 n=1 Tax=Diospyros lotus TaxID=55363 RepID=UPI00224D1461|nr:E3 ubiquitin-protein ligase complex slx8-rfp subunit slx8-like isoform X2 [Diospyros lotus]